ncbi:hypothetical protein EVAR_29915_1 [Eumeta japonica]|uniref:Uncharacterized protein n=1 Tax=Eumeta variegata TaxID=151549 RepID=A0A4C1V6P5_EUMVA|nr:hypothetical protein EVAR_29915_1 [Eumeta japonica]
MTYDKPLKGREVRRVQRPYLQVRHRRRVGKLIPDTSTGTGWRVSSEARGPRGGGARGAVWGGRGVRWAAPANGARARPPHLRLPLALVNLVFFRSVLASARRSAPSYFIFSFVPPSRLSSYFTPVDGRPALYERRPPARSARGARGAAAARNKLLTSISIRKKFLTKVISTNLAPHFVSMARRAVCKCPFQGAARIDELRPNSEKLDETLFACPAETEERKRQIVYQRGGYRGDLLRRAAARCRATLSRSAAPERIRDLPSGAFDSSPEKNIWNGDTAKV